MRFKKFTFNLLSIMIGFHYGRNPVSGDRFLHVAPVPFFGIDFYWPADSANRIPFESPGVAAVHEQVKPDVNYYRDSQDEFRIGGPGGPLVSVYTTLENEPRVRIGGLCPLGTPGCKYSDCGPQAGRSCYGPNAPRHIDMSAGPGDLLE